MPGVMIAGTHSGCGKTTVAIGLLAALIKKGHKVQAFKTGPDFIDSGLHKMITGRPSRNLDLWMCGEDYVRDCYMRSSGVGISVVEGVMGLYDGEFSTAALASVLKLPIVLVIDSYGMAESAGALVRGFTEYGDKLQVTSHEMATENTFENSSLVTRHSSLNIAGVIFNRVASENHYRRLCSGVGDTKVFGYLPRELDFEIPHRHLGLTVAEEDPISRNNISKLADAILKYVDVKRIIDLAAGSVCFSHLKVRGGGGSYSLPKANPAIAVAYDKAFCFYYEDNLDLLRSAGAEIVRFSPLADAAIPKDADAVYIGGGYPELYAETLSKNTSMLGSVKNWADSGRPIYAECGGLMYLSRGIHDFEDNFFEMASVFPFETRMKKGRLRLGYREVSLMADCILGEEGAELRGHEFHYSEIVGDEREDLNRTQIYSVKDSYGQEVAEGGYVYRNTLASYIHIHFGSNPDIAKEFVKSVKVRRRAT